MKSISNEEHVLIIEKIKKEFQSLREEATAISTRIIGKTLCAEDLYFCAIADRCIRLIDGMSLMLQERNLTCAGALLRMQMDNCMRTYAAYIANNKKAVIDCVIDGKSIRNQDDVNGKKMTDNHLKKELSKIDERFNQVYAQASGYIHFSEKAFYQTVVACENNTMEFQIGLELPEKRNGTLLECADAFIHYCKLYFELLKPVVDSKERFDTKQIEKDEEIGA